MTQPITTAPRDGTTIEVREQGGPWLSVKWECFEYPAETIFDDPPRKLKCMMGCFWSPYGPGFEPVEWRKSA